MQLPEKLSEKVLFDNGYRRLLEKKFEIKNSVIHDYQTTSISGINIATMIIPITSDWQIIYNKEFKYWPEKLMISFPVGVLDEGISRIENAKKELKEESWYETKNIEYIWETIAANYDDTIISYFLARNCVFIWQDLELWEYIETYKTSVENFEKMILSWEVKCPLTISCFFLARSFI